MNSPLSSIDQAILKNFAPSIGITILLVITSGRACAQIVPDRTLGSENSSVQSNVEVKGLSAELITGGAIRQNSLFHSFLQFNVEEGGRVYFANPVGIEHIFSRVTGNQPSNILGTLGVDGGANLFLLNPNGIIFGQNAQLDVAGSFFATSANSIKFSDGSEFSAANPQAAPLLKVDVRSIGLGFWATEGGAIVNRSLAVNPSGEFVGLAVSPGKTLGLLGKEVQLEGGILTAPGGRIELGAISSGEASLNLTGDDLSVGYEAVNNFGNIQSFQSALVDVSGEGGGYLQLVGENIKLGEQSLIYANTKGNLDGRGILIRAKELQLEGGSQIITSVKGLGKGGNIEVSADSLKLVDGGQIATVTESSGNSGDLTVKAKSVEVIGTKPNPSIFLEGSAPPFFEGSGLATLVAPQGTGNGGTLNIVTDTLKVLDGGQIRALTYNTGNAGDLNINARLVEVIGIDPLDPKIGSGIFGVVQEEATGNGGNITIVADSLRTVDGGQIGTGTFGAGSSGELTIKARSIEAIGSSPNNPAAFYPSGLFTTVEQGTGNSGTLNIVTDSLRVADGAQISANTFGAGKAGEIKIQAQSIDITGANPFDSSRGSAISASVRQGSTGDGGTLTIVTDSLRVVDGGQILVSAFPDSTGKGGKIDITATNLNLNNNAVISAQSQGQGNAGEITIKVGQTLSANNSDIKTSSTRTAGGAIDISAKDIRLTGDSDITTNVESGVGNGGNITLTADSVFAFDDSDILAFAKDGTGGNINFNTRAFFGFRYTPAPPGTDPATLNGNARVDVNASGAIDGIVNIPDASFIQNSLTDLPENQIDTSNSIANSCIERTYKPQSSFTVTGSGALPERPREVVSSSYPTGEVRGIPSSGDENRSWQKGDPIVEATGGYRFPDGRLILGRDCSRSQPE